MIIHGHPNLFPLPALAAHGMFLQQMKAPLQQQLVLPKGCRSIQEHMKKWDKEKNCNYILLKGSKRHQVARLE